MSDRDLISRLQSLGGQGEGQAVLAHLRQGQWTAERMERLVDVLLRHSFHVPAALAAEYALDKGLIRWPFLVLHALSLAQRGQAAEMEAVLDRLREVLAEGSSIPPADLIARGASLAVINNLVMAVRRPELNVAPSEMVGMLEILKTLSPDLAHILDGAADRPAVAERLETAKTAQPLLRFPALPMADRRPRRVAVAMRHLMFPERPDTREFDMPARIRAAFRAYGWEVDDHPLMGCRWSEAQQEQTLAAVAESARDRRVDLLVLDLEAHPEAPAVLARMRERLLPETMVVLFYGDPWKAHLAPIIRQVAPLADRLWSVNPSIPLWTDPRFAGKTLFLPWLHGGYGGPPPGLRRDGTTFVGGVEKYNWTRACWLAQARIEQLDIRFDLSSHKDDGRSALDSFHAYLDRIAGSAVSLNFALHSDMGRTLTARAFEALLAGSLLVQEYTPDHDSYFVDGKHYLSFVTMEDLIDVMGFVRTHPEEAEAIRRAGHHLMRTAYGDEAIVGCFDRLIAERESG